MEVLLGSNDGGGAARGQDCRAVLVVRDGDARALSGDLLMAGHGGSGSGPATTTVAGGGLLVLGMMKFLRLSPGSFRMYI